MSVVLFGSMTGGVGGNNPTAQVGVNTPGFISFSSLPNTVQFPLTVPKDFLGMCFIDYPNSGPNPNGVLNYGSTRMTQLASTMWANIETSAGVYSSTALTTLDSIITNIRSNGGSVYFGLYNTPTFYAQTAANPTYGDNITKGPWNYLGECSMPNSLTAVANFVTMIITRYNLPSGSWYQTHGATLGKGIQYWETWNEPHYSYPSGAATGNGNTTGSGFQSTGQGFFWGSANQLVDLVYTQYSTIKSLDSSVKVSSPGFAGNPTALGKVFLGATGAVNTGVTGLSCIDALAFHPYGFTPQGTNLNEWNSIGCFSDYNSGFGGIMGIQYANNNMASSNSAYAMPNLPWWISEWGVSNSVYPGLSNDPALLQWYAAPPSYRYTYMGRCLLSMALMGIKMVHPWHWQETNTSYGNSGDWQGDPTGVTGVYNFLAQYMAGQTFVSGGFIPGGIVAGTTNAGLQVII